MTRLPFQMNPDPGPAMTPSQIAAPSAFTTDDRTELDHTHFNTDDESVLTGTWQCAPTREVIDAYPVHEMMHVVSGRVRLTHADGTVEEMGPGDTFFIAKGTPVVWEITETLRKIYIIVP